MPPNPTEDIWKERENQLQISHAERKTLPFDLFLTDFYTHIDYFGRYTHIIEYNADFVYRQVKFEKKFQNSQFHVSPSTATICLLHVTIGQPHVTIGQLHVIIGLDPIISKHLDLDYPVKPGNDTF